MSKETVVVPIKKLVEPAPVIPASVARNYIADMLCELCAIAQTAGQNDLHELLKITRSAVELSNNGHRLSAIYLMRAARQFRK